MPNTAVTVREGATVFCLGPGANTEDATLVNTLFSCLGLCARVQEAQIGQAKLLPHTSHLTLFRRCDGGFWERPRLHVPHHRGHGRRGSEAGAGQEHQLPAGGPDHGGGGPDGAGLLHPPRPTEGRGDQPGGQHGGRHQGAGARGSPGHHHVRGGGGRREVQGDQQMTVHSPHWPASPLLPPPSSNGSHQSNTPAFSRPNVAIF